MKSIMEEASSISKAIENGWVRAGKPQEFSIKVFEDAERNFLGMVRKSAKIAIFYAEKSAPFGVSSPQTHKEQSHKRPEQRKAHAPMPRPAQQPHERPAKQARPAASQEKRQERRPDFAAEAAVWPTELVDATHNWVKEVLSSMEHSSVPFKVEAAGSNLHITFQKPLAHSHQKERLLFSSFVQLIMTTLRNRFKRDLRGLRIVITSNTPDNHEYVQ